MTGDRLGALQREHGLYEYPWPKLLGLDAAKWERTAKLVDKAARRQHDLECASIAADGITRLGPTPYTKDHAGHHKRRIRMALVDLLDSGIPSFLTEPGGGGS